MNAGVRAVYASIVLAALIIPVLSQAYALESLPSGVTMFTEEKRYVAGDTVRLFAQLHEHVGSNTLALFTVYAPDSERFLTSKQAIKGDLLDFAFSLDKDEARTGLWTVNVRYLDVNEDATFTLFNKGLYDRAILNAPALRGMNGGEIAAEDVRAGSDLAITAVLENDDKEGQPYVFVAQVLDESGLPVFVSLATGTLAPGQNASPAVNWRPAESGTYTIEIFAWNSLSSPAPYDDKRSGVFEVY